MGAVGLIFKREFFAQVKTKGFAVTMLLLLVASAGFVVVPNVISSDSTTSVVVSSSTDEEFVNLLRGNKDLKVEMVDDFADVESSVAEDDFQVGVSDEKVVSNGDEEALALVQSMYSVFATASYAQELGLSSVEVEGLLSPDLLEVVSVADPDDSTKQALATLITVGLFFLIMTSMIAVAVGVVEEKGSRIVEILLVAVRPYQLLAGKILAFGAVGLIQIAAIGVSLVGALVAIGALGEMPSGFVGILLVALGGYVLGFLFFASGAAAVASLVSRQEEVNSALGPLTALIMGVYGVSYYAALYPDGALTTVMSFVPPFSSLVMPVRYAGAEVGLLEVFAAVSFAVVAISVVLWLANTIYRRSILRTGKQVKLREVLKSSGS